MSSRAVAAARQVSHQVRVQEVRDGRARKNALKHGQHIELNNVPLTATSGDLQRAIDRVKLQDVQDFALIYSRFKPTGTALVTLKRPDFLKENLRLLDNISIAGTLLKARPAVFNDPNAAFPRARGAKGRQDAVARGVLDGNGPHAGIGNSGKNVMLWGFPGKTEKLAVKHVVRDFDLDRNSEGELKVFKIEHNPDEFSMYSRFLLQLTSVSEAQRLVRQVNMTYFEPETLGDRFMLRARIIY